MTTKVTKYIPFKTYSSLFRLSSWSLFLFTFVSLPVVIYVLWGRGADSVLMSASRATGLIGLMLLLAAFAISRVRVLTNHLGIEVVLRSHRAIAVLGVVFIVTHVGFATARAGRGFSFLDPTRAPTRVIFAESATLLLLLSVGLAITRRRRAPRYEGWRLWHLLLAWGIVVAATIHVLLLRQITTRPACRAILLTEAALASFLLLYRWLWRPLYAYRHSYIITEVRREATSTVTVVMRAHKHSGVQLKPGQFMWMKVGHSPFVFAEHPFTISSGSTNPNIKEVTIKALGDFTEVVEGLRIGRRVYLHGPHGRFTIDGVKHATGFVFIAGGVGITPMISMIRTLAERGDKRPHVLVVSARTISEFMFQDELIELRRDLNLTVVEVMANPPEDFTGIEGRITVEVLTDHLPVKILSRKRRAYFICGPPLMVASAVKSLEDLGVPDSRIFTELFNMV